VEWGVISGEFPLLPATGNSLVTCVVRPSDAANLRIRPGNRDLRNLPHIKAFKQREENLIMSEHLKLAGYYTGCPRRNVPDFGTVFLMLKYNDITQNTYIQI
jgi:hypothetical protein